MVKGRWVWWAGGAGHGRQEGRKAQVGWHVWQAGKVVAGRGRRRRVYVYGVCMCVCTRGRRRVWWGGRRRRVVGVAWGSLGGDRLGR